MIFSRRADDYHPAGSWLFWACSRPFTETLMPPDDQSRRHPYHAAGLIIQRLSGPCISRKTRDYQEIRGDDLQ